MSLFHRSRTTVFAIMMAVAILIAGTAATPAYAKSQPRKMKRVIRKVGNQYHLKKADINALIKLCKRESDFNPRCRTGSYKGLFQIRSGKKKVWDPVWNTARAIRDIRRVYKTPRRALAHSYRYGWY